MKKLLLIIIAMLFITALAGCNYGSRVPALPPYNTNTTGAPTTVPYGANDPLSLVPPSNYSGGLAPDRYMPGGPVNPDTR